MLDSGTMTLGVNYWASHAATQMWSKWDADVVDRDLKAIAEHGMTLIRVFPLWHDFQPLNITKYCGPGPEGRPREMRLGESEEPLPDTPAGRSGMSETMMERFEEFADIAEKYGIKLIAALMTAHMTGRLYVPRAMENRDLFSDPFALKWEARFYDYFVRRMKNHPAIFAWETGNESNYMHEIPSSEAAWVWTCYLHNIIRLADDTHPIIGVPVRGLNPTRITPDERWLVADQAEHADIMNVHKYDCMSGGMGTLDGYNHLRNVFGAAAENRIMEDVGGKPSFIEETGLWRTTMTSLDGLGKAVRNIMWNCWADNCRGLLWWCSFDQEKFDIPPYNWGEWPGLEHGIFTDDRRPHPAAGAMKKFRKFLDGLPFKELPRVREDAVCLIDDPAIAKISFILARQNGINLRFRSTRTSLTDSDVYFLPSVELRGGLSTTDWEALLEKVRNGATLYLSYEESNLSRQKDVCGMELKYSRRTSGDMKYDFVNFDMTLPCSVEKVLDIQTAEILGKDSHDNPVFLKNRYGTGTVYALMLPLEKIIFENSGMFEKGCWQIYRTVLPKESLIATQNPDLIATEHFFDDTTVGVVLVNCSMDGACEQLEMADGWTVDKAYSECDECSLSDGNLSMPPNSGMLVMLKKESARLS